MTVRQDLRNVAIVAHVDHGKTTLVDAMLWEAGAFGTRATEENTAERVMDSGELEREKGITILAKNTAVHYRGPAAVAAGLPEGITINVIDTPGHADFGGEVERGLSMVDGVVLLVDASEGPLPQTRFVLRKALAASLPVILVVNKVDRPDSRISEVVSESTDLLLSLASDLADEHPDIDLDAVLDLPVIYASAKARRADTVQPADGELPANQDLEPLFRTIIERIPGPSYDEDAPLQAHVTNLDASPFLGRLALLRIRGGSLRKGQVVAWARHDGSLSTARVSELLVTEGLDRKPAEEAHAGDIVAVAGIEDITIGESLVDPDDPRPLPLITVDDPAISMTIGINTSPMAGRTKGAKVTARQVKDRLDRELIGNVSLRVLPAGRPDAWEDARTRLFRFYDTIVTETAVLPADDVLDASRHHHAVVAVTPARRRDVERTRRLLASLRTRIEADATGPMARRPARLLHAVVVSSPRRPLIPPLHRDERLIPYDDVLALTSPGVTAPPGLLRRRTAVALTRLAADVVGAATAEEMTAS